MKLINSIALLVAVSSAGCYALETGNLTVIFSDTDGKPITNATVKVTTSKGKIWGHGGPSDYFHYEGRSDSNGVASIDFGFRDADFDWDVETPSHYSQAFTFKRECFDNVVEESDYLHVDTNTVEGLARYEELRRLYYADDAESYVQYISKMQPKNITYTNKRIVRSLCFYPKRNPQPMYVYGVEDAIVLPKGRSEIPTNGYIVIVYPQANVDLMNNKAVRSDAPIEVSRDADFSIEQYMIETNGVYDMVTRFRFADGCGAYRAKRAMDDSFPTLYAADTNAEFVSEYEFSICCDSTTDELISQKRLLNDDECLVLRTRMSVAESGCTNGWHYSKILGPIRVGSSFSFRRSVFNPRLNDPNLEFDIKRNLARPKSR